MTVTRDQMIIVVVTLTAGACIVGVSAFMWWATKRNALFAIVAGVLLVLIGVAGALIVARLITRQYWGALDPIQDG